LDPSQIGLYATSIFEYQKVSCDGYRENCHLT